jgi:hypothetical protein
VKRGAAVGFAVAASVWFGFGANAAGSHAVVRIDPLGPVTVSSGRITSADLTFTVADGYHVQANPASAEYLIPAVVEVAGACGVTAGAPEYPRAVPYRLHGADSDLATYAGRFQVRLPLSATTAPRPTGTCVLHGTLRYQACDARICLAPATLAFELPLTVR